MNKALTTANVIPLFSSSVACGFPSPADDYIETPLDLNEHLIRKPSATFYVRAKGLSMIPTLQPGDLLVVDRSQDVTNNSIVLAVIDGEYTVKRFLKRGNKTVLVADNPDFKEIDVTENSEFNIWGKIIHCIRSFK